MTTADLRAAADRCNRLLDKLAGGPHFRDEIYETLELAKDALERAATPPVKPCTYCNGTGDATKG